MPRLVIKQGPGVGRDQMLGPSACVVGRDEGADFVLEDELVSRRHFQVLLDPGLDGGRYVVEDLGSTNGTRVNGRKARRAPLADGDLITVGETAIAFVQKDLLGGPSRRRR